MSRFRTPILYSLVPLMLVAGCPTADDPGSDNGVTARISISARRGSPPLMVTVNGADSTSDNGAITAFRWDFGGQASADTPAATHTFVAPGLYPVTLRVTDETGAEADTRVDVQVQGTGATALIAADRTTGAAPLTIRFDGTGSSAPDDTIRDFFWDFGDGREARQASPVHTYTRSGTFTVTLRVATAGGVEATDTETIELSAFGGTSLQFNGSQFATLPVAAGSDLAAFTFEAWVNPTDSGGTVATLGSPSFSIDLLPGSDTLRVRAAGETFEGSALNANGRWQYLALVYTAGDDDSGTAGSVTCYLGGVPLISGELTGNVSIAQVLAGGGFSGNITRVRLWSVARSASQIAADEDSTVTGGEPDLLGGWTFGEGNGQTLSNVKGGTAGTLGAATAQEATDPAWSNDGP